MRVLAPVALFCLTAASLRSADLEVRVEIPRLEVAEYHRPYIALWVENPDQSVAANLAVWCDQQTDKSEKGTTWLKDLRQWWRKSGRSLTMPVDGVSGATRPPGAHQITFRGGKTTLATLKPGAYQLAVEASREVGGRELLRIPFEWPPAAAHTGKASGAHELGEIVLTVKP